MRRFLKVQEWVWLQSCTWLFSCHTQMASMAKTFILTTLSKPRKAFYFQMQKWKRVMSRKTLMKRQLLTAWPSYPGEEIKGACIHAPLNHASLRVTWKNCLHSSRQTDWEAALQQGPRSIGREQVGLANGLLSCIRESTASSSSELIIHLGTHEPAPTWLLLVWKWSISKLGWAQERANVPGACVLWETERRASAFLQFGSYLQNKVSSTQERD